MDIQGKGKKADSPPAPPTIQWGNQTLAPRLEGAGMCPLNGPLPPDLPY